MTRKKHTLQKLSISYVIELGKNYLTIEQNFLLFLPGGTTFGLICQMLRRLFAKTNGDYPATCRYLISNPGYINDKYAPPSKVLYFSKICQKTMHCT